MIRRPMRVMLLPTRQDLIKTVEFSDSERREYHKIEKSLRELPDDVTLCSSEGHLSMNIIQLINKLRLFCNLGVYSVTTTPMVGGQPVVITSESEGSIGIVVASEEVLGGMDCEEYHQMIDIPDIPSTADISPYGHYSNYRKLYCGSCAAMHFSCCKETPFALSPLSPKMVQMARNDQLSPDIYPVETSKIRALVQEIQSCLPEKR
jgi:hypothetical protein